MKQFKFWTIAALCAAAFAAFACFDVEPTGTFVDYESATLTGEGGYTIDVLLPEWTNQDEYEKKLEELKKQNGNDNQFAGVAVTGTPFTLNLAFSGFVNEQGAQVIEADDPIVEMSIWYWKKNGENGSTGEWTELKKIENPQFAVEGEEPLALFGRGTIPDALGYDPAKKEFIRVVFYFKSKSNKETFCMKTFQEKKSSIDAPKEVKAPVLLIVPLDNTLPEY